MKKPKQRAVDYHSHKVRVGDAGAKGRGVFARCDIKGGEAIEAAPTLVIARSDVQMIRSTFLIDYSFGANDDLDLIGLGFVSLYNHSFDPNASSSCLGTSSSSGHLDPSRQGKRSRSTMVGRTKSSRRPASFGNMATPVTFCCPGH